MPIIKPEVQKVLRTAGLLPEERAENATIHESLDNVGLTTESIADELAGLALRSNNEALRLRALETVLKVKGALKDTPAVIPSFTVVIQSSDDQNLKLTQGTAPHLFPRQSLELLAHEEKDPEKVN
jgi:hypothetical protein